MSRTNYQPRAGRCCITCKHSFVCGGIDGVYVMIEEGLHYYCTLNALPRPGCMAFAITDAGEMVDERWPPAGITRKDACNAWQAWTDGKEIEPGGLCDDYVRRIASEATQ